MHFSQALAFLTRFFIMAKCLFSPRGTFACRDHDYSRVTLGDCSLQGCPHLKITPVLTSHIAKALCGHVPDICNDACTQGSQHCIYIFMSRFIKVMSFIYKKKLIINYCKHRSSTYPSISIYGVIIK